jgi:hypothetical protein
MLPYQGSQQTNSKVFINHLPSGQTLLTLYIGSFKFPLLKVVESAKGTFIAEPADSKNGKWYNRYNLPFNFKTNLLKMLQALPDGTQDHAFNASELGEWWYEPNEDKAPSQQKTEEFVASDSPFETDF